ncbi:hypothetical protein PybrP1_009396 [[Pythium] brassicae (nom. inval.)]|nr:hypothetical protein PybrP1_009396 [[Pythium] brassicae (nom. inval.)]
MSTGLHSAREELGLPSVAPHMSAGAGGALSSFMGLSAQHPPSHHQQQQHDSHNHALQKPLALSPRSFGMDDLRDFCGPLGTFKTGLTPRFSTGLTPRSGFTPRFSTGFTPRINITGLSQQQQQQQQHQAQHQQAQSDTNAFFSRNTGFSPRASDVPQSQKISPTGFTPKDVSGMKMRYPGSFTGSASGSPQKHALGQPLHHPQLHHHQAYSQHLQPHHQHQSHHPGPHAHQHESMGPSDLAMNMSMYEYMSRPTLHPPPHPSSVAPALHHAPGDHSRSSKTSPVSDKGGSDQEDMDERRRMKNRERVRKCRKRKQDRLNFLEDRTAELEKENHQLKSKVARQLAAAGGVAADPLSEAQLAELRAKQNATIAAYVRAHNEAESGAFDATAHTIWTERAEVACGAGGSALSGLEAIVSNKRASHAVFAMYQIRQVSVQWKAAGDKCAVHWEVDAALRPDAPRDVPLTAPFADLGAFFGPSEVLSFRMTSHVTFDGDRIAEEIRQLNLLPISEAALAKFAQDPQRAADALQCLLAAAA